MVRHVTARRWRRGAPWLAVIVAGGGLAWHILACVESPMAFSPDGRNLAFVTIEPIGDMKDEPLAGEHAFRLMVLAADGQLRVLEQTVEQMLTAPGYSPDGRRLCYLRVPLQTPEEQARVKEQAEKREQILGQFGTSVWDAWLTEQSGQAPATGDAEAPATQAAGGPRANDAALPLLIPTANFVKKSLMVEPVTCTLVERDAVSDEVLSSTSLTTMILPDQRRFIYGLALPQYSRDGQWVYVTLANISVAVQPASGQMGLLAGNTASGRLSPDGRTLAAILEGAILLCSTDGQTAVYRRWAAAPSYNGLAWIDSQTLAVLEFRHHEPDEAAQTQAGSSQPVKELLIHRLRRDGTPLEPVRIPVPPDAYADEAVMGDLAIAPDGRSLIVAYEKDVFFATPTGKVIKHWHDEKVSLSQPTFAPDSRRVAFKRVAKGDNGAGRADAIVFFTPRGESLEEVLIPAIKPGTTRPATRPETQPAPEPASRPAGEPAATQSAQ